MTFNGRSEKRKRSLKVLIVLLSIVLVIALAGIGAIIWDSPAREELKNILIADVDFEHLNDGVYKGEYNETKDSLRDVAVEVTVKSGVVTEIK